MNHRTYLNRVTMLAFVLWIGLVGNPALGQHARQKQVALNRQLIAALMKGDNKRALALVHAGADPNTHDNRFTPTALALACGAYQVLKNRSEDTRLVQVMLDHRANVNASEDYSGCVAGSILGWRPGMSMEAEHPVKIGAKTGCTPLKWAAIFNRPKTARLLLDHRANVNAKDHEEITALEDVAADNSSHIVRLLLEHGANSNVVGAKGHTPLMDAYLWHNPDLIALLKHYGARK
jgi:ankyrin repeat protein